MVKPAPDVGQWWSLDGNEGVIARMLPGGGGGMGIAVFDGDIPPAHVSTMLHFPGWKHIPGPTKRSLPPPCTCRTLDDGVIMSDGCPAHDAAYASAKMGESVAKVLEDRKQ